VNSSNNDGLSNDGPIDGLFGQGVELAVMEFEDSQGFATDGVAVPFVGGPTANSVSHCRSP
jgi:peptidoglycan hydrolase-like protein with peptidoglycan-binding domain